MATSWARRSRRGAGPAFALHAVDGAVDGPQREAAAVAAPPFRAWTLLRGSPDAFLGFPALRFSKRRPGVLRLWPGCPSAPHGWRLLLLRTSRGRERQVGRVGGGGGWRGARRAQLLPHARRHCSHPRRRFPSSPRAPQPSRLVQSRRRADPPAEPARSSRSPASSRAQGPAAPVGTASSCPTTEFKEDGPSPSLSRTPLARLYLPPCAPACLTASGTHPRLPRLHARRSPVLCRSLTFRQNCIFCMEL